MKKILVLSLVFLFSCGISEKGQKEETLTGKNEANSGIISDSKENIKQICDSIKLGNRISEVEKKFGKAILLTESETKGNNFVSYYYGKIGGEICMISTENAEIKGKEYLKL